MDEWSLGDWLASAGVSDAGDSPILTGNEVLADMEFAEGMRGTAPLGPDTGYEGAINDYGPEANYMAGEGAEGANAEIAAQLAKTPPSIIAQLAQQFGIKMDNPAAGLSKLISAIGLIRNQGANDPQRTANTAGLTALLGKTPAFSGANTISAARAPVYHSSDKFITAPPDSAGPLTQIRTSGGK